MRLATRRDGTPDGKLMLVSRDHGRAAPVPFCATLQEAVERWTEIESSLLALSDALEEGSTVGTIALNLAQLAAPLPRAWQWLDGSAYPNHGRLMQQAFDLPPVETDRPLMYQGLSDTFLSWCDDVPLPSEEDGIDFEGEFAVVVDQVAMGTPAADALTHVRLVMLVNDWSLRAIAPVEMRTGFGWIQAKPACSAAPIAVTPDELGDAWSGGRIGLALRTDLNGQWFGEVPGNEGMEHGFDVLIAHACRTRPLVAGTIIGSGTVSSDRYAVVGSSCVSERRAIEMIEVGAARTPFLRFGDRVRMKVRGADGRSPFGVIDQRVVRQ